jgi:multidrug efflux pump
LLLVSGPGAAARNSIGTVLVGGMAIGTLFTVLVVPSVYVLVARDHAREVRERESLGQPAQQPAPG